MSYNEITVLKNLEGIRSNPSMYIGAIDEVGLHHLFQEVFSNSIDEYLSGYTNKIRVILHKDGSLSVQDFGRGVPNSFNEKEQENNLVLACSKIHSGAKFSGSKNYNSSAGLHGVGLTCCNALSIKFRITSIRDGSEVSVVYEKGNQIGDPEIKETGPRKSGTIVRFMPDPTIFKGIKGFDQNIIKNKLKEFSYLCKDLQLEFENEKTKENQTFISYNGIIDYVKDIAPSRLLTDPFYSCSTNNNIEVSMAFHWVESGFDQTIEKCYTNNVINADGGTHLTGFKSGLTKTINSYISKSDLPKSLQINVTGDDVRDGLVLVLSIKHPSPSYSSQIKNKLVSENARTAVETIVSEQFMQYLEQNPVIAKNIVVSCINSFKAREAARKAKEVFRKVSIGGNICLPGKLADCQERDPSLCEIFIVEGQSAGGSAKMGRDRKLQAILPLRGKVLNTERAEIKKIIKNEELINLVTAIGTNFGKNFNIDGLRYHKIIICCDADVDGSHIMILLLTFFYRQLPKLIENGHIYIAQPPLFRADYRGRPFYFKDITSLEKFKTDKINVKVSRFKGLGEMDPNILWETTLNPETRTLLKIYINDYLETDRTFFELMGLDVERRKSFIINSSEFAKLDI